MSLVLNMIGGGGSFTATDAILRVQAPATAIVTISKGGTVKTDYGHENITDPTVYDYYFIIHQSQFDSLTPWSVTATVQGITNTKTIIINASDEYDLVFKCRVPDGYQEVEYLGVTSSGAVIDPDIVAGNSWFSGDRVVEIGWMSTGTDSSDLFGGFDGNSTSTYNRFYIGFRSNNGGRINYGVGNDSLGDIWTYTSISSNTKYETRFVSNNLTVQVYHGSTLLSGKTLGRQPNSATRFVLFADYSVVSNSYSVAKNMRIYYCRFYKDGVLEHDLIPCYRKSDSVKGMFDRATNTFYTNANSTGTFIVGSDVN